MYKSAREGGSAVRGAADPPETGRWECDVTEAEIFQVLTAIFRTVFARPDMALSPGLSARDVPGWDSFKQIEVMMAVEERFGIELSTGDIDSLRNVGDLAGIVLARGCA